MRSHEFISKALLIESATPILYHYTRVGAADKILQQGEFKLSSAVGTDVEASYAPPGYPYFLSTSRSRAGDYVRYVGNSAVMFVLDGDWISQRYKVKPIDYWDRAWLDSGGTRTRETEDRVFSRESTMSIDPVLEMHVLIKEQHEYQSSIVRQLLIRAKVQHIPVWLYSNESAWKLQDKRRAVSPAAVRDLLRGVEPKRVNWPKRTYLDSWLELIYKNSKKDLSSRADRLRYNIQYYSVDGDHGLKTDLSNARKPDASDHYQAVKIIDYMRKNQFRTVEDLIAALKNKWKDAV